MNDEDQFEKSPSFIYVAADLHPYNIIHEAKQQLGAEIGDDTNPMLPLKTSGTTMEKLMSDGNQAQKGESRTKDEEISPEGAITVIDKNNAEKSNNFTSVGMASCSKQVMPSPGEQQDLDPVGASHLKPYETEEEYSEDHFDYEYDDLIIDDECEATDFPIPIPTLPMKEMDHILISEDPPFSEKDLDEFIYNESYDQVAQTITSDGSFHSLLNSVHSFSSFALDLGKLGVHKEETSKSNSSKRKGQDGMEDTTSSFSQGGKKPRN